MIVEYRVKEYDFLRISYTESNWLYIEYIIIIHRCICFLMIMEDVI